MKDLDIINNSPRKMGVSRTFDENIIDDIKKMMEDKKLSKIILEFIKRKELIIYGGYSMHVLLKSVGHEGIYKNYLIPNDYDVYSTNYLEDAKEILEILKKEGYDFTRITPAFNLGTAKIFVNYDFDAILDITHIDKEDIKIYKHYKDADGFWHCNPELIKIDLLQNLSCNIDKDSHRFNKAHKRYNLMEEYLPSKLTLKDLKKKMKVKLSDKIINYFTNLSICPTKLSQELRDYKVTKIRSEHEELYKCPHFLPSDLNVIKGGDTFEISNDTIICGYVFDIFKVKEDIKKMNKEMDKEIEWVDKYQYYILKVDKVINAYLIPMNKMTFMINKVINNKIDKKIKITNINTVKFTYAKIGYGFANKDLPLKFTLEDQALFTPLSKELEQDEKLKFTTIY